MIIPVTIGLFALGGAFDFFSLEPNRYNQIFDYNAVKENLMFKEAKRTDASYIVAESTQEMYRYFGIEPAVALKMANGNGQIGGFPNQVLDSRKEVNIFISYRIVKGIETFPATIKQGRGWQNKPQRLVGTHYVNATEYGGFLTISITLKVNTPEDLEEVRNIVNSRLGKGGSLDATFFKQLEYLTPALEGKATLGLSLYYNVVYPMPTPTTLSALKRIVEKFPERVEELNEGKGAPLRISLEDLHTVQSNFSEFKPSRDVLAILGDIEKKFDDLRIANLEFRTWESQGMIWTPEQEQKINEYQFRLQRAKRAMSAAIADMDITGSTSQFDQALRLYNYDGEEVLNRYTNELEELIKSLEGNFHFRSIYSRLLAIQEEHRH